MRGVSPSGKTSDPGNRAQRVNRGVIVFHTVKVMLANSLEVVPSESGEFHVV